MHADEDQTVEHEPAATSREWVDLSLAIDRPDDPVPTPEQIVALARRFHRQLRVALNLAVEDAGLSYAAFEVLAIIDRDPGHHAASVAHALWSSRQAVARLVASLVDRGLLRRLPVDHGVRGLALTTEGQRALADGRRGVAMFHEMFACRLPEERRWTVLEGLNGAEAAIRPPPL